MVITALDPATAATAAGSARVGSWPAAGAPARTRARVALVVGSWRGTESRRAISSHRLALAIDLLRALATEGLPAFDGHLGVARIDLDRVAAPTQLFGGDQGRA